MLREKEPMSMEMWADRITEKLEKEYSAINYVRGEYDATVLWNIIFDAICLFQELQDKKDRNPKEERDEKILEKKRQEGA